jgi:hypothetical protein
MSFTISLRLRDVINNTKSSDIVIAEPKASQNKLENSKISDIKPKGSEKSLIKKVL